MVRVGEALKVPGVHDFVPPQGRVTVKLCDPYTGRVKKTWREENAIMDWYLTQVDMGVRSFIYPINGGTSSAAEQSRSAVTGNLNPFYGAPTFQTLRPYRKMYMNGKYPWGATSPVGKMNWLWMSDNAVAANSTHKHIPGNAADGKLSAYAKSDVTIAPDSALFPKRGNLNLVNCTESMTLLHMQFEFATNIANGTHRSLGIGSISHLNQNSTAPMTGDVVYPSPMGFIDAGLSGLAYEANGPISFASPPTNGHAQNFYNTYVTNPRSCAFVASDEIWWCQTNTANLIRQNPETNSITQIVIAHGGTSGATSVTVNLSNGDLWLAHAKTLRRCVKPTNNVTLTVTNTYVVTSDITDAAILDICTDGTYIYCLGSSKVFKFTASTGVFHSSWSHGLTGVGAHPDIVWDPTMLCLWINPVPTSVSIAYQMWGRQAAFTWAQPTAENYMRAFSGTGTAMPKYVLAHSNTNVSNTNGNSISSLIQDFAPDGISNVGSNSNIGGSWGGPSMASHAVLGSDVVKTSSDVMIVEYDWTYS